MTTGGRRSHAFRAACDTLAVRHLRTRIYTPRTNGKAERFIQTLLREWAYAVPYATSADRRAAPLLDLLQSPPTTCEPQIRAAVVTASDRCVMNNVFDFND